MKKLALILTLLTSSPTWSQGDIEAGKLKSVTCAACHGQDGNSVLPQNPSLAGQHTGYLEKQLYEFKLGMLTQGEQGRMNPVMSAMAMPLNPQDIKDLSAYYSSQTLADNVTPEDVLAEGQALYLAGDMNRGITACIACHGPRGNGTSLSGFPKISGQHAEYVQTQLEYFRSGQRNNDMNGMMRDVANKLTDEDIVILSQYVGGLH